MAFLIDKSYSIAVRVALTTQFVFKVLKSIIAILGLGSFASIELSYLY